MQKPTEIFFALRIRDAERGIEYKPGEGARCPWCGQKLRVMDTKPWIEKRRVRYQICVNDRCPLCMMDKNVKTIEKG